jgi:hypothetical protein
MKENVATQGGFVANAFVVTDGCYSDYRILSVCSTREIAEETVKKLGYGGIETWELDRIYNIPPGYECWSVAMRRDGALSDIWAINPYSNKRSLVDPFYWSCVKNKSRGAFIAMHGVLATDATHAIKIANEYRVRLIANNEWGCDYQDWIKKHQI